MTDMATNGIVLPLDDPGKADVRTSMTSTPGNRRWRQRLLLTGISLGLCAIVGVAVHPEALRVVLGQAGSDPMPSSAMPASTPDENGPPADMPALDVVALGRIKPTGGIRSLALPHGAGDARIARLMVEEGDTVNAGQIVAELDNLPMLLAAEASARSNLAAQQATLKQVRASMLASLAEARASHMAAKATVTLANQDLARQTRLAASNSTTQVLLEQAQANAVKARAELDRTSALVARFSGAETDAQADIVLAARNLDLASANLARATEDLASARVIAPQAGIVLAIHARASEKPSTAGVMTIADVRQMTVELEVYQTDVTAVKRGQPVSMTASALSTPLTGRVTRIGQIVEHQSVMSTEPAANADARVVRVTVTLDPASSIRARSYTNLEVVGRIRTMAE